MDIILKKYKDIHDSAKEAVENIAQSFTKYDANKLLIFYYLISNIKYFLKSKIKINYLDFFKKVMIYQRMSSLDFNLEYLELLLGKENIKIKGEDLLAAIDKPRIYCCFHMGSYRLPVAFLSRLTNSKGAIIIDNNVIVNQSKNGFKIIKELSEREGFKIINAESLNGTIEMVRFLRKGGSLFFYIDGNTGVGGMKNISSKMLKIKLFESDFYARKGIAQISYITKTPIIPVITYKETGNILKNTIHFFKEIIPNSDLQREFFVFETTQHIYNIFSEYLLKYPTQWEGWLFFQYFIEADLAVIEPKKVDKNKLDSIQFNHDKFGLFKLNGTHYVYDLDYRVMYKLKPEQFEIVYTIKNNIKERINFDNDLNILIKKEILLQ